MSPSTDLCNASATGRSTRILHLLQNGAPVNGLNEFNRTPIQVVMLGSTQGIEVLLTAGANPNVRDPSCGLTVTHDAAREGFLESVRILINGGADVNVADNNGNLPLHLAAREGHLQVVKLLIGFTEEPRKTNNEHATAEQLARDRGKTDVAAFIQNYQNTRVLSKVLPISTEELSYQITNERAVIFMDRHGPPRPSTVILMKVSITS